MMNAFSDAVLLDYGFDDDLLNIKYVIINSVYY